MDTTHLPNLDPDLAGILEVIPETDAVLDDVPAAREMLAAMVPALERDEPDLDVADLPLDAFGSPATARVLRPREATGPVPAIVHFHGGGFCLGGVDMEHPVLVEMARELGAVVVSVEYRLSPEHPYPAGFDDCYAGLLLAASLDGVDPDRIAVMGTSAGGALAAAVALAARDRSGPRICLQVLDVPVLDDRMETASMRAGDRMPMWTRTQAEKSWEMYLDGRPADSYAAPARAQDLSGLPPAYVAACEYDPLRDEAIAYAARMLVSGVSVELHTWPGTFHGAALVQGAPVVTRMHEEVLTVLKRALAR
ncbi:alpha/beta hydrolase [Nocardioides sp.]|uniref:alpha/beta hydrolase n=1 Tax=Nocardioides sp. TaxID=35761 RepID=UPI0035623CF7